MTVEQYLKSEQFYKIINALDIDWNGVNIGDGIVINDTSDLIAWILSLQNNIKAITQDAPSAFDTLKEFADWIANDTTGAAKMAADIGTLKTGKVDKEDMEVIIGDTNGHDFVDLGLPSGTKWATMNVGASSITDYGNYYQYGKGAAQHAATIEQSNYNGTENPLDSSVDTATQVWGGDWYMPTKQQLEELIANTTYEWVTNYQGSGINGATFTANGQTLFIPAAGYYSYGSLSSVGSFGFVWSSTPYSQNYAFAYSLYFGDGYENIEFYNREGGYSVRPVINASKGPKYATKAELNAKQNIIDSSHKLNADLIENGTTNKVINVKPDWNAASGNDAEILNKPSLATVATSGSYNDLKNKPTIPSLSGYATQNYVGQQIYYALSDKQSILQGSDTQYSPGDMINLQSNTLQKFANVNFVKIDCTNIQNPSQRAILLLQTGSSPDINFVYNTPPNGNNDVFYGTTGILYAGSSGVFQANSKYMIYFIGSNIGCIITQFKLSDTPVAGENGVEETTGGGPGWRAIEGSSYNGEILVDSAGKVVMIEQPETVFYRYLENGSTYAICDSLSHAIPPQEQQIVSSFGTQTYNCTVNSDNSPIYKYTLTIDGTEYGITYNASDHTMTTSPELGKWSAPGLYWRTSKDSSFQKVLVDYTGKVFADGTWDSVHTAYFTINSGGSFQATGGAGKPQNSIDTYGVSEYSGQWDEPHVQLTVTVNGITYTITYDGTNGGVSPEITDWVEE